MNHPASVFLVEDNDSDVQLITYAFQQTGTPVQITRFEHGKEFLSHLSQGNPKTPSCVLLDISMPFMSGHEVLEALRKLPLFQFVPIVVFTSSDNHTDIQQAYERGANAYVKKPNEFEDLCSVVQSIVDFWLKTNFRL